MFSIYYTYMMFCFFFAYLLDKEQGIGENIGKERETGLANTGRNRICADRTPPSPIFFLELKGGCYVATTTPRGGCLFTTK